MAMVVVAVGGMDEATDRVGEVLSREACWGFKTYVIGVKNVKLLPQALGVFVAHRVLILDYV